jgi:hypothetical protein
VHKVKRGLRERVGKNVVTLNLHVGCGEELDEMRFEVGDQDVAARTDPAGQPRCNGAAAASYFEAAPLTRSARFSSTVAPVL